jgi:drug/metabolite transporter (DMT)-like permease
VPTGYRVRVVPPQAPAPDDERRGIRRGHIALVAVQLCFGSFPVFGILAFEGFSPRAIAGWRFVVGALVLGGIAFWRYGREMLPRRADLLRLQVCALLGVAFNMVVFLEGLERTTAVNSGLLMPIIPVYTLIIAVAVGQERFAWRRGLGIALAFGGTLVLLLQKGPDFSSEHLVGNVLILTNCLSYSIFLVVSKPLLRRYPPMVVIAWVFLLSVWTVPLFAWNETFVPADASRFSWFSLGWVLLFPTVISYLLNTYALSKVAASTTATYILLQPLITCTGGVLILGESFLPGTGFAAAAILLGVWLVVRPQARQPE